MNDLKCLMRILQVHTYLKHYLLCGIHYFTRTCYDIFII